MENIEAMLCAYIEGDLDEAGRAEIEKHLASHPQHRQLIADLIAQRQLLRDLPRASAPADVAESLRGQLERSLLLGSADTLAAPRAARGWRWPQLMTVAAIVLLSVSLGLIVYRVLAPTSRPPAYTQVAVNKAAAEPPVSEIETDIKTAQERDLSKDRLRALAATEPTGQEETGELYSDRTSGGAGGGLIAGVAAPGPVDLDNVRKRLQEDGYDIASQNADQSSPVLLVIDSPDPAATGDQVGRYLNSQSNIAWNVVRGGLRGAAGPTTQPTQVLGGQNFADKLQVAPSAAPPERPATQPELGAAAAPATQPSLQQALQGALRNPQLALPYFGPDIYVARGLTQRQTAELEQNLDQSAGVSGRLRVSSQSARVLATTQPSQQAMAQSQPLNNPAPATQESQQLTEGGAMATTLPSVATGAATAPSESVAVDAVIVVQPETPAAPAQAVPPVTPATTPSSQPTPPATQP